MIRLWRTVLDNALCVVCDRRAKHNTGSLNSRISSPPPQLQCKSGSTVTTIRTFGVEEINAILKEASEWATQHPEDALQRPEGDSDDGHESDHSTEWHNDKPSDHHISPSPSPSPSTAPIIAPPPSPLPQPLGRPSMSKEARIRSFCDKLHRFLMKELRDIV
eukprot:c12704_g1_i1.p1 GENE.c12704_g1_i1~~c12704_g1_i1.p1  ORF type:complete len:162 (-),score=51.21 c12704_g1_i1:123-608(-)